MPSEVSTSSSPMVMTSTGTRSVAKSATATMSKPKTSAISIGCVWVLDKGIKIGKCPLYSTHLKNDLIARLSLGNSLVIETVLTKTICYPPLGK
jgi:hypothetical protein